MGSSEYKSREIYENKDPMLVILEKGGEETVIAFSGNQLAGEHRGLCYALQKEERADCTVVQLRIRNGRAQAFTPDCLELTLGVNTYMAEHPERNDVYFPTMLRCEKTRFHGYFMTPKGVSLRHELDSFLFCLYPNY